MVATIDSASRYHVAALCKGRITYLTSTDGVSWVETIFQPPAGRFDVGPQLAVDGDMIHLAFSRDAPERVEEGCGGSSDGLRDVGVYTRTRQLPSGRWSEPVRVGPVGDSLQSFRAVDGVLHLTVSAGDSGPVFYESQLGPTSTRIRIPRAITTSLRVGDDGQARIAYNTYSKIRHARVSDGQLSVETIAEHDRTIMGDPLLVLGAGDRAYIVWGQEVIHPTGDTCGGPDPTSVDGTYLATNASGRWTTARITRALGPSTFTVDPKTGRIHAIVDSGPMTYYTSAMGKQWAPKKLAGTKNLDAAILRLDPRSGKLVVFANDWNKGIYILSKP
jgi:hypothetical protein